MAETKEQMIKRMGKEAYDERAKRFNDPTGIIGITLDDKKREELLNGLKDKSESTWRRSPLISEKEDDDG